MATEFQERARRLRNAVEPVAAGVYFAPEAHAAYSALGFAGSPVSKDGVDRPELKSYFTSRARAWVRYRERWWPPRSAASTRRRRPSGAGGWQITDRDALLRARSGATEMLQRVLGDRLDGLDRATELLRRGADAAGWAGRPIFGGLLSLGFPGNPVGDLWRAADLLREHRGDSHVISWAVGGADAVEILLLTEQWWGLPARAYAPTRGWAGRTWTPGSPGCGDGG